MKKLKPTKGVRLANLGQVNRALLNYSDENVEELQKGLDEFGAAVTSMESRHRKEVIVACLMSLLDGYEMEGDDNLTFMVRSWHARAVLNKRSWEAS